MAGVICTLCGKEHRHMTGFTSTQGVDCASCYVGGYSRHFVLASYGSDLDGNLYEVDPASVCRFREKDPICDDCLREAIELGQLHQLPGDYPWGMGHWDGPVLGEWTPQEPPKRGEVL